ncbi:MAG TPA: NifU N-terminal domain-containing protein [Acidimicrobiia bacterium]|nr:NifU N-terminal domain-containing protein [Acidimicrobiia bacterium]
MPVPAAPTPNPNAMKFTVGVPVGGPATHSAGQSTDPAASELLKLPGVVSVFMTADFVTVTKTMEASWETLLPQCVGVLTDHYG